MGKITGVLSLKGGVGKTSAVASLGHELSILGKKVLLVDGNFSSPNLGLHFNIVDPEATLHHVISRLATPSQAIQKIENLDVLPSSLFWRKKINPLVLTECLSKLQANLSFVFQGLFQQ